MKGNPQTLATAILHGKWAVDDSILSGAAGLVAKIIQGETPDFSGFKRARKEGEPDAGYTGYITPGGLAKYPWEAFYGVEPNSIGLLEISGTMLKADNCDDGMDSMTAYLYKCYENSNISGVLLMCDSGGGQVAGTEALAKAVADRNKPVVAWVNGMAASACYWVASQADMIVMNGQTSEVGSIGVMVSAVDLIPYWEKMGIKVHTVLADGSEDKNKNYFDLLKGKYEGIKAELNSIREIFHTAVKTGRGDKLKGTEMLTGGMYPTEKAIALGMADKMGKMEDAIAEIRSLQKSSTYSNSNPYQANTNMGFSIFSKGSAPAASQLFEKVSKAEEGKLKADEVHKLNDILEANGSQVRVVGASDFEAVADAGKSLTEAEDRANKAEARVKELEAEVEALGKKATNPSGSQSTKTKEASEIRREDHLELTDEEFEAMVQTQTEA